MKTLWPLLLVFVACGKKSEVTPYYEVDPTSLNADSDGDGELDWDETYAGRDPYLADIDETLPTANGDATLLDANSRELKLNFIARRTLRNSLVREISSGVKQIHPHTNELILHFEHSSAYWRARFDGFEFDRMRLQLKNFEQSQKIPTDFKGQFRILSKTSAEKIQRIRSKTYRLVVSTPTEDFIFHLASSVTPGDFLQKKFHIIKDVAGRIIQINDWEQNVSHTGSIDFQADTPLWQAVGLPLNLMVKPKAGETYALVFGTSGEFQSGSMNGATNPAQQISTHAHKTSVIVFIPSLTKFDWSEKILQMPIGNQDRERTCQYAVRKSRGYSSHQTTATELVKLFDFNSAEDIKVKWLEQGSQGVAARIEMLLPKGVSSFSLSSSFINKKIAVGVVQSDCPQKQPVKTSSFPLWKNPRGEFLWLP